MVFFKKAFPLFLTCSILISSAFAIVSNSNGNNIEAQIPVQQTQAPTDTSRVQPQLPLKQYKQETYEDLNPGYSMDTQMPSNVKTIVEYDPKSGHYIMRTMVGEMEIATPFLMTEQEYRDYAARKAMQDYWKLKNETDTTDNEKKFSISDMKFEIPEIDKVFGPGGVQVKTQGSAELIFGLRRNKLDNPTLPERNRDVTTFDFDEKIQLNVNGKVGNKIDFGLNYNTESTFDFDKQLISLKYRPPTTGGGEDDIIRNIEAGNVSMQLNSSLITGSSALFGIKTELQFGKLNVIALASQQQSQTQTVSSKGGVQTTEFDINIDSYDENRHFFLAHYFRNNYEKHVANLPYVSSGIIINRAEVWITNKRGNYDQARNIIAFMDLGETSMIDNPHWNIISTDTMPRNRVNSLYEEIIALPDVRNIQFTNSVLEANLPNTINGGEDYEKIENARRLDASEYTLNTDLGFISLRSQLNPDEVLAVAYEYTYKGKTYQVGEFSTTTTDSVSTTTETSKNNALVLKLLKGTAQSPELKTWNLMMKNIYSLGALQVQQENFKLNIVYRNDSVGTDLQYISEGAIKNKILLRVMNLDRLNTRNNIGPDGKFDYIEGYTILSNTGRIIFPVLEPFGSHLRRQIANDAIAGKYVYQELYDSTLVIAQEFSEKNKFRLVGEYKASSGSEIRLNAMNVPRGSVTVMAGGQTLVENVDYTVDYIMGTVTILNQSLIESTTNIEVKLENQSMFSMQRKTLVGTHLEYQFSKNFSLGGTIMHLSETPLTTKVNTGSEPLSNTIWGLNTSWRHESQWLTNMIDKIPFVNATQPSTIALNAEFAQLIPGHSDVVSTAGLAYIDDFESTKTSIDIHYPFYWSLSSTPSAFPESKLSNNIEYGFNRAHMAWFYVDNVLNSSNNQTPNHLKDDDEEKSNHYTRRVRVEEVFPNKETSYTETSLLTPMNISFYPTERGMYNLDTDGMNPDGTLMNPEKRWGGIMRRIDQTDFETSNIEYIEFWMMDPFIYDKETNSHQGGELYFNLGDISEDVLKDGKKFFEHGLNAAGDITQNDTTIWGAVPKTQSTVTAFDNSAGARKNQDVGFNGLSTEQEFNFSTYQDYVARVRAKLTPDALARMEADPFSPLNDPSGDNYHFYRGSDYDEQQLNILNRYKYYNGTEGNSPDASDVSESYSTSATSIPDVEDVNGDNTLNEYEKYYQYRISLKHGEMNVGSNYIADKIDSEVSLANGKTETVTWYQFRIPIREYDDRVGSIRNFKSIRFIRMYLTGFKEDIFLRFATMDLVRGEWRTYTKDLFSGSVTSSTSQFNVQAVNIEENADKAPVNYVLPPGVSRQTDPGQPQLLQQNEQAMLLRVNDLVPGEAKAVYKNTNYDMRQYKRLQMFVHAEKLIDDNTNLKDNELSVFVRLGSDMTNNYYEYEIPLKLTEPGNYSNANESHRELVWPQSNMFDFPFTALTDAKLKRNKDKQDGLVTSLLTPYSVYDPEKNENKITIVGNPSISNVENILIGVRNASGATKSGEVWVNELRMSEFDESGGWAAMANLAVGLSDIGTVSVAGRTETAGFGGIESNVLDRRLDDLYQINFATSLDVGRFFPEKARLQLPAYFSYTNETLTPKYNPLDEDILLDDALDILDNQQQKDSLLSISQTVATSKSFNVANAKVNIKSKTPQFYDPANFTFGYAQTETNQQSADIEKDYVKTQQASISYSYSFNTKPWEPFKDSKALSKPAFKIIKDINFNYLPNSISFNTNMNRQFSQTILRNFDISSSGSTDDGFDLAFAKEFLWNRQFDIKYNPTRSVQLGLTTAMNSNIDEPYRVPELGLNRDDYEHWRDTVWRNIKKLGTPYTYQQVFTATWNVPINKLPLLDFINTSNISYNATYNWDRGAEISDGTEIGNIITSRRDVQFNAGMNFETLYNKSKYLQGVNRRYTASSNRNQRPFQPKKYTQTLTFEEGKEVNVNHRLGSDKFDVEAIDKSGRPVKFTYKSSSTSALSLTPLANGDSITVTITTKDPNARTLAQKMVDFTARGLMMVRNVSGTYRQSNSLVIPGFRPEAGFMGQNSNDGIYAPGFGFAFGIHDENTVENAYDRNWLVKDENVVNPAIYAKTADLDLKANIEPIPDLKIALNAKQNTASNTTVQYMIEGKPTTFTGSYNLTILAIRTAFTPLGDAGNNYNSELFNNFRANRQTIVNRLQANYSNARYPNTGFFEGHDLAGDPYNSEKGKFTESSPEVLIPAFLAAYTGKSADKAETSPFLSLLNMFPNWRITYNGLSRLDFVKKHFNSISLTHGYTSIYSIGAYTSFSSWVPMDGDNSTFGYILNETTNNPIPSAPYDITSVSITEQFMPLIGVNAALKNSITAKVEFRKQRTLALNLTSLQLIETASDEFVVGAGYTLKDFDVILRLKNDTQSRVKNDLRLNMDVSYKDIKSLLRKIDEDVTQPSSGNKLITIKFIADYVFSSKMNIQLFYDRQINTPLISTSYPVSASNFGVSFKFMLTR